MWNLINNNLKIFIDPFVFINKKNLYDQVLLVNTFKDYLTKIDPNLCEVTFFYPKYVEEDMGIRRIFLPNDRVVLVEQPPSSLISVFPIHPEVEPTEFGKAGKMLNEFFSIAIQNKCVFYLSENEFNNEKRVEIEGKYGIQVVNLEKLYKKIEYFLQGFYNYFKFGNWVYGIDSPDIAHSMSDVFLNRNLIPWEDKINKSSPSISAKERVRSFIHNRYIDILVTIDKINFFKLQQRIFNVESGIIDNKEPRLQGYIRYYLNYYLFLLWGATDHLAWIINDLFSFGFDPEKGADRRRVGLNIKKNDFLDKIESIDLELSNFIKSKDFQDWLYFFSELRHKSAHREMFSAGPLLLTTPESEISDDEIDKILYKDNPPIPESTREVFSKDMYEQVEQNQKIIDRRHYRISKMKKGIDHFASVEKDGQQFLFDPVARMDIDSSTFKELIQKIISAYYKKYPEKQ